MHVQADAALLALASLVAVQTSTKKERRECRRWLKLAQLRIVAGTPALPAVKREASVAITRMCGACGQCRGLRAP